MRVQRGVVQKRTIFGYVCAQKFFFFLNISIKQHFFQNVILEEVFVFSRPGTDRQKEQIVALQVVTADCANRNVNICVKVCLIIYQPRC